MGVTEDPSEERRFAQAKLEEAFAELPTKIGSAHLDSLVLKDRPQCGTNGSPILSGKVLKKPFTNWLVPIVIFVELEPKGRLRQGPQTVTTASV